MKPFQILAISFLFFSFITYANPPIKFGKVSEEELLMTVYEHDSSAPAVVLCDYGFFNLRDYMFTRIVRIKILNKEGLYLANDIYPGIEKTEIRGKTYNLENGEIIKTKLKNESIFRERVHEDYYNLRIAMPNVKVGSVFEIELRQFFPPATWAFQREIPIIWSELIMPQSQYFDMQRRYTGYESLYINSSNRWVAKDMPAFKTEPFTNSSANYITKFDIDLERIAIPGVFYKDYATDWNAVAKRLEESDWFGGNMRSTFYLNSIAKEIKENYSDDQDKLKAAYEEIQKIKWNENKSLYCSKIAGLGTVLREGTGNSADINILLVNLLNKLAITSYPVILSTRDNGTLSPFYPSRSRLNYVITYAKLDDKEYLLDATDNDLPMGMLPRRCLNGLAQIIMDDKAKRVDIIPSEKKKTTKMMNLQLNEDYSLTGSYSSKQEGYDAYDFRKAYKEFNSEAAFVENIEDQYSGLNISNYTVNNLKDLSKPVKEKCDVRIDNRVFELEDKLYINPLLHLQMEDNPFKLEERKYPVDYTTTRSTFYTVNITLPEGYVVDETPLPIRIGLPEKSATVLYNVSAIGNRISIMFKLDINKPVFLVDEYQLLKEFYSQIIEKHAEPIIIKKS
jgi:hypothetical protein